MGMIYLAFGTAGAIWLIILIGIVVGVVLSRRDKKRKNSQ
ncbi:hypothetical protein HMPREF0083_04306 [Aneurinibacillus aneurinilyticus ATCC 12856]|uniref:Uncharacterized protein n=1 Tax=Aneurinibacillus aneurinilyticus ATCC 12856 TaxID=649747 RepID=U1Y650_ANEAE|nr:hypothetical protein HMPREF0083_04306 [Aneurinibacillus aneurinilyticus ATCC 12856]